MSAMRRRVPVVVCVLLSVVCLSSIASAQTNWTRAYGGAGRASGYSVQQTADGGYVVAGANGDVYLVRTNAQGDTLWTRTYGGPSGDYGHSVQQTTDGGFIVAGLTWSFGSGSDDFYLVKTNAQGDTLWTRTYGGPIWDEGYSVRQTSDGGYIIVGYTHSYGAGGRDVYLIRTDAKGDTLWTRTYGGTLYDQGYSVQETDDGGFIVAGLTDDFGGRGQLLIKVNASGDTLWTRTYGGSGRDLGVSVKQTLDGGYIIAGGGFYLVKTDAQGDTLWTGTYGGGTYCQSAQQTTDGGYIAAGWTRSFGAGGNDVYLVRTNAQGDTL